jgi:disulfide bond formation protein DsbB
MVMMMMVVAAVCMVIGIAFPPLCIFGVILALAGLYIGAKQNREKREAHGQY